MPDCKCSIAGDGGDKSRRINENKQRIDFLYGIGAYTTKTDPALNAITTADVDDFLGCIITLTAAGNSQTLPVPTDTARYHSFTVGNAGASTDNIDIVGAATVTLEPGERTNFIWATSEWIALDDSGIWFETGTTISPQRSPRSIAAQSFKYDTAYSVALAEGEVAWDSDAGTLRIGMPGGVVELNPGQETHLPTRPKNVAGVDIDNGQLVYVFDAASAVPYVKIADASDFPTAKGTIAMATEDVPNNQRGYFTAFGSVKNVNTAAYAEGTTLYLDTTAGGYTDVCPEPPNACVTIGLVTRQSSDEGEIFVTIDFSFAEFIAKLMQDPTGFQEPENVTVSYDATTRKITLGGTVNAYYQGVPYSAIFSGYVSPAHVNTSGVYFLVYDGTSISWKAPASVNFYDLLIAYAIYQAGYKFGLRECHEFMPWRTHYHLHDTIGTFRDSGGVIGDYVLSSTTAANRRPSITQTVLYDEDLLTVNAALAAGGNYTRFYLSSADTANFSITATEIVPLSGNQPYYNQLTGGNYVQTLMSNNNYMSIWLVAVPVTADAESQKYRFFWIQGQTQNLVLANEEALTSNDVNLGTFETLAPEFVFIGRIIIRYTAANWVLIKVEEIKGNRVNQSQGSAGIVQNEYPDNLFRILDNGDATKKIAFEASGITTATTRTLTVQDRNGTISLSEIAINDQAGNYNLLISDIYKLLRVDTTVTDYAVTFPQDSLENIPINSWGEIKNIGTNDLGITQGTGVTFQSAFGNVNLKTVGTYGFSAFWHKTAANTFEISGAITTA